MQMILNINILQTKYIKGFYGVYNKLGDEFMNLLFCVIGLEEKTNA